MENSYQSFHREQIEGTPFIIETDEEKGFRIGLGNHGITDWDTDESHKNKAMAVINGQDWNFMVTVIAIICDRVIEQKTFDMLTDMKKEQEAKNGN